MNPSVLTFGELMLRLTAPHCERIAQARHFEITFGGAEANVAVAIAQLGGAAGFITKLPDNELADRALTELRGLGVDVTRVARGGDRIGVYFLETGASLRASKVIYDRAHSAIAEALPEEFAWESLLAGAEWFHWSGITPALSPQAPEICRQACAAARKLGLGISFDVNYRAKLWSRETARAVLSDLIEGVDLLASSPEEAQTLFRLRVPEGDARAEVAAARALAERFGAKSVALTMREASTANRTRWGAMLYHEGEAYFSRMHDVEIVDRLGAGDSFTGSLLFFLRRGDAPQAAIDLAVAASALKHTIWSDYNLVSLREVEALAAGAHGGRVQR